MRIVILSLIKKKKLYKKVSIGEAKSKHLLEENLYYYSIIMPLLTENEKEFISDHKLIIIFAGIGYILAWGFAFYTMNLELAKDLAIATISFLFGGIVTRSVNKNGD